MASKKKVAHRRRRQTHRRRQTRRVRQTRVNTRRHRGGMGYQTPKNNEVTVSARGVTMSRDEFTRLQENQHGPLD